MSDKSQVTCYFAPNLAWGWDLWWTYLAKCRTSSWEDWASFPAWMMIIQIGAPNSWSSHVKPSSNPTIYNNPSQILNRLIYEVNTVMRLRMNQIYFTLFPADNIRGNRAVQTRCSVLFSVYPSISRHIQPDLEHITPPWYMGGRELIVQNIFLGVGLREINKSVSGDNRLP